MAVRIRESGKILCAAMHPQLPGDAYIDDGLHYELSVERKVLVTEPMYLPEGQGQGGHAKHGRWWWKGQVPASAAIDPFYTQTTKASAGRSSGEAESPTEGMRASES